MPTKPPGKLTRFINDQIMDPDYNIPRNKPE